ncbi:2OG-Fe dioxygenase family protein [Streptomyces gobiensis]|uniref:2OG-Fe dioxygenase family protein n=1 Tax=Streptomyces gobiensis TaxID=2875706 RepID=UPI001E48E776|nr:2OG-Fe dioxygenase family protein [Streptomyces gobiensis]UGY92096.1 2OG-Fe dioxygenase family protein [Streptomyces gobiensis]
MTENQPQLSTPGKGQREMLRPYVHLPADTVRGALAEHSERELKSLTESWAGLPVDRFMKDAATYRRRRYSAFRFAGNSLVRTVHGAFRQSTEVNPLHGGVAREFAPMEEETARSGVLRSLVLALLDELPGDFDRAAGSIGVHQIRILASRDETGLPAPEGIHEDGHHFVAQVLMRRDNVVGGESRLYDREREPLFRTTLLEPFETIIIDDRRVFHGVSPIEPGPELSIGVRDMMLVDFMPLTPGGRGPSDGAARQP